MSLPPFAKTLEKLSHHGSYNRYLDVFRDFVTMAACTLAPPSVTGPGTTREEEYMQIVRKQPEGHPKIYAEALAQLVDEMEAKPYHDCLGDVYQEWSSASQAQHGGEFFTPHDLCRMMARMTVTREMFEQDRAAMTQEPACGSGRFILATVEVMRELEIPPCHLKAVCIDVNKLAADMCYVNLTLHGIPAEVIHGNTLSLEQWAVHRNIFWYGACGLGRREDAAPAPINPINARKPRARQFTMEDLFEGQESMSL